MRLSNLFEDNLVDFASINVNKEIRYLTDLYLNALRHTKQLLFLSIAPTGNFKTQSASVLSDSLRHAKIDYIANAHTRITDSWPKVEHLVNTKEISELMHKYKSTRNSYLANLYQVELALDSLIELVEDSSLFNVAYKKLIKQIDEFAMESK